MLANSVPNSDQVDMFSWKADIYGCFILNSRYRLLFEANSEEVLEEDLKRALTHLWKVKVSTKIQTNRWRLFLDKLPTREKLSH